METSAKLGKNSTKVFIEAANLLQSDFMAIPNKMNSISKNSNLYDINKKINSSSQNIKVDRANEENSSGKCNIF